VVVVATVTVTLHPFENGEAAPKAADMIRQRGELSYIDDSGDTVTVTVGDVTVEQ
jgi:hypothetical protein